jgi:hypothetical protein
MPLRFLLRLPCLLAIPLLVLGAAVQADDFQPPRFTTPKSPPADPKAKAPPHAKLPITDSWDTKELLKLGKLLETRSETKRIVWTLEVTVVPKDPRLAVDYLDDERGRLYTDSGLEYKAFKGDAKDKLKRLEVILKLPPLEIQQQTNTVVFRKVETRP